MRRADVIERLNELFQDLDVPRHVTHIKRVAASLEVTVLINGTPSTTVMRSGITPPELEQKLGVISQNWALRDQVDIEHLLARKRRRG